MSVYFNELTIDKLPQQTYQLLKDFRCVWRKFINATDKKIKQMILPHSAMAQLCEAVYSSKDPAMMEFLHFFCPKFRVAPEDTFSSRADDRFNGAEYHIELENGKKVECQSLGWAALNRSLTLGLQSSDFWKRLCYEIEEESIEYEPSSLTAICITAEDQIDTSKVQTWIAGNRKFADVPKPVPCELPYEQRRQPSFNVPHHENEKLKAFSDKIVRHAYVRGVVGTLPFESTTSRFILKCYEDGTIDVRLHWTETGCGLKVQTQGKGLRQTEYIAQLLSKQFDKRS